MTYIGRFAPSPTGPLHFGSLVAALASYLDARAHSGRWLVRMENLDPPREQPGAEKLILDSLEAHHLHWDGAVLFQSERHKAYREALNTLQVQGLSYRCKCTRKALKAMGGIYNGTCRNQSVDTNTPAAIRLNIQSACKHLDIDSEIQFNDLFQGTRSQNLFDTSGDFIIHRKDGLFAYQLAVIVDDIEQHITHIIRGADLLDLTARQILLFELLRNNQMLPEFGHIPIATNELGQKLSKQHHAPPLDDNLASDNLYQALIFLNQHPPDTLCHSDPTSILQWAVEHWQRTSIPAAIPATTSPITQSEPGVFETPSFE